VLVLDFLWKFAGLLCLSFPAFDEEFISTCCGFNLRLCDVVFACCGISVVAAESFLRVVRQPGPCVRLRLPFEEVTLHIWQLLL